MSDFLSARDWERIAATVHSNFSGICVECGNDDACEGYELCSDCLEELDDPGPGVPDEGT